jgi:hypothetical protein
VQTFRVFRAANFTRIVVLSAIIVVFNTDQPAAFDKLRKGFVGGGSVAVVPHTQWTESPGSTENSGNGWAASILGGYAWNARNMLAGELTGAYSNVDGYDNGDVLHSLRAVLFYHWINDIPPCVYLGAGVGSLLFYGAGTSNTGNGFAFKGELGYEAFMHMHFGVYAIVGWTYSGDFRTGHQQFGLLVKLVGY